MNESIIKTINNLKANNMEAYFAEDRAEALKLVEGFLKPGDTVASGGSVTLNEIGILKLLRNGSYNFLDRFKKDLTRQKIEDIFINAFSADAYLCSSNAVTENGELFNVDGNCNRIACLAYGPKSVIVIVGTNKIVPDLSSAVIRVKTVAAPLNAKRLGLSTYCSTAGHCVAMESGTETEMCSGCKSDDRICATTLVTAHQRIKNRIKVIIINKSLGF